MGWGQQIESFDLPLFSTPKSQIILQRLLNQTHAGPHICHIPPPPPFFGLIPQGSNSWFHPSKNPSFVQYKYPLLFLVGIPQDPPPATG